MFTNVIRDDTDFVKICVWQLNMNEQVNHLNSQVLQYTIHTYCQTSNISCTLIGNKIVDNSDVVGASPAGAAPTTSSYST